jgi:hypothetical protein
MPKAIRALGLFKDGCLLLMDTFPIQIFLKGIIARRIRRVVKKMSISG